MMYHQRIQQEKKLLNDTIKKRRPSLYIFRSRIVDIIPVSLDVYVSQRFGMKPVLKVRKLTIGDTNHIEGYVREDLVRSQTEGLNLKPSLIETGW